MKTKMIALAFSGVWALTACGDSESFDYGQTVMVSQARILLNASDGAGSAAWIDGPEHACRVAVDVAFDDDSPQGEILRGMDRDDVIDGCVDALDR